MEYKVVHIGACDKFIPPFIQFVKDHFDLNVHEFLLLNGMAGKDLNTTPNVHLSGGSNRSVLKHYWQAIIKMHQVDKVILHGLFDIRLIIVLFLMPWLLKKCHWMIWGGDLYVFKLGQRNWKWELKEFFRRPVIKNIGFLVTYIDGDIDLARSWYGARGKYLQSLMYTSNLYKRHDIEEKQHSGINILLGNSADPSNNHLEALKKLQCFKDKNFTIYIPLSYGNQGYSKQVIKEGRKLFGSRFVPLTTFLPLGEYLQILASIDIAIFNHKRQQAMGNIITLLGLGKKVYVRREVTQWPFFEKKGIKIFDVEMLDLLKINKRISAKNINIIKSQFSENNYLDQLRAIFH